MDKNEFLLLVDEVIEAEPGTLTGGESLDELAWDSLAVLGFIALMDERLSVDIPPKELSKCKTVNDLYGLVNDRVAAQ